MFLTLHSWLRWCVVVASLATCARAFQGWLSPRPSWRERDRALARIWVGAVDAQILLGLTLYFTASPIAEMARSDLGAAHGDPQLRFFGFVHPTLMMLVALLTHVAWIAVRRVDDARARFRRLALGSVAAIALMMVAIPWPSLGHGRPLFRM